MKILVAYVKVFEANKEFHSLIEILHRKIFGEKITVLVTKVFFVVNTKIFVA